MTLLDLRGSGEEVAVRRSRAADAPVAPSRDAAPLSAARYLGVAVVIFDAVALVLSLALGTVVRGLSAQESLKILPYGFLLLAAMSVYGLHGRTFRRVHRSWFRDFGLLFRSLGAGSIAAVVISGGLHRWAGVTQLGWAEIAVMSIPALAAVPVLRGIGQAFLRRNGAALSRVAVVGSSRAAERIARRLQRAPDFCLVGVITDGEPLPDATVRVLGGTLDLWDICERNAVDRLFVSPDGEDATQLSEHLRHLPDGIRVSVVPAISDLLTWQSRVDDLDGMAVLELPSATAGQVRQAAKRTMDIVLSALALICLAPVLLLVAALVKFTSPGPVFFRQVRIGYMGQPFSILKFRTMRAGADDAKASLLDLAGVDGRLFKVRSDPRVTSVGRFLRTTSIDELPQFLNVLIGHMSLVGPRPLVPTESACFDGWATRRFKVKPGMTGLWQVSGRSDLPFEELCQLDYAYAASWSLWWDLKILSQTPASVLRGRGAY